MTPSFGSVVILLLTSSIFMNYAVGQQQSQSYFCDGELIQTSSVDVAPNCYYISNEKVTWNEAFTQCHQRGGFLTNCIDCNGRSHPLINTEILKNNDLIQLWSGYTVRDYLIKPDEFPIAKPPPQPVPLTGTSTFTVQIQTYEENPFENQPWVRNSTSDGDCVTLTYSPDRPCPDTGTTFETTFLARRKRQAEIEQCTIPYFWREFTSCQEKRHFVCTITATAPRPPQIEVIGNISEPPISFGAPTLDYQLYLSNRSSTHASMDDVCGELIEGGTALRLLNQADKVIFNNFASNFGEYRSFLPTGAQNLDQTLFWTRTSDNTCEAILLGTFLYQTLPINMFFTMVSWPCGTELFALCQAPRKFEASTPPRITVSSSRSGFEEKEGVLYTTSEILRDIQFGGGGSEFEFFLRLECNVPELFAGQRLSSFRNKKPVNYIDGDAFNRIRSVNILLFSEGSRNIEDIDFLSTYHCEMNERFSNTVIKSEPTFIRLTDYDIFAVQLPMNRSAPDYAGIIWDFYSSFLTGTYVPEPENPELPLTDRFLSSIASALRFSGNWNIQPKTTIVNAQTSSLAFYMYRRSSEIFTPELDYEMLLEARTNATNGLQEIAKNIWIFDTTSITVRSISYCHETTIYDPITNRRYQLNNTSGFVVWNSSITCARDGRALVTVKCEGDRIVGFEWGKLQVNPLCDYSNTSGTPTKISENLKELSQETITEDNVNQVLNDTRTIVERLRNDKVIPQDVAYISDIVQKSTSVANLTTENVQDILNTVSVINRLPTEVLEEARNISNAPNRLLKTVDELGSKLVIDDSDRGTRQRRLLGSNLALEVWKLEGDYSKNAIVGLKLLADGSTTILRQDDLVSLFSEDKLEYKRAEVAILLPKEFIESQVTLADGNNSDVRLSMNVYQDTTLYTISGGAGENRTLNSKVVAAQLTVNGRPITDLGSYEVKTVFLPDETLPTDKRSQYTTCAYWDFSANENAGGWETDGCRYEKVEEGRDVCVCDHLTNFAVLLSFYGQDVLDDENAVALSVITIVFLSLSIVGLSISALSFLCIKKVRQGRPQQTLFNLCIALLATWIVFLAGIEQTSNHAGCIVVAVLLHYLVLASFMWMLMEGILQYLLFVKVMNTYFSRYMLKTAIPAWGLPIIPVIIILAIDPDLYRGGDSFCWMALTPFWYGFVLPVGLIILANIVLFILVVSSLWKRKDMSKHSSSQGTSQTVVNLRASFICFCVLGLSWIFGFLAIEDARVVFQYLFCIFACLQGFIIFLMMTARDKNIRNFWRDFFCKRCKKKSDRESSYTNKNGTEGSSQAVRIPRPQRSQSSDTTGSQDRTQSTSFSSNYENLSTNESEGSSIPKGRNSEKNLDSGFTDLSGSQYGKKESVLF